MRAGPQFFCDCVVSLLTIVAIMWWFFAVFGVNGVSVAVALVDGGGAWGITLWWSLQRAGVEA